MTEGLANAKAKSVQFRGGAGDFRLDFGGRLQQDLPVDVAAAAGNLVIVVPEGVAAKSSLDGLLRHVSIVVSWLESAGRYVLQGSGHAITLDVKMRIGKLELRTT